MKLLTPTLVHKLPPLYRQEKAADPIVYAKFFAPWTNWTWFVTEGQAEGDDFRFFGYVCGNDEELGNFMLSELEGVTGPGGVTIERDLYFTPGPLSEVLRRFKGERGQ